MQKQSPLTILQAMFDKLYVLVYHIENK